MPAVSANKHFYVRLALIMLIAAILAGALEYRSYELEQARREDLIRSTVNQTLDAIRAKKH